MYDDSISRIQALKGMGCSYEIVMDNRRNQPLHLAISLRGHAEQESAAWHKFHGGVKGMAKIFSWSLYSPVKQEEEEW